jgi:tight adherence protein C
MSTTFVWIFSGVIFAVVAVMAFVLLNQWIPTLLDKRLSSLVSKQPVSQNGLDITTPSSMSVNGWIAPFMGNANRSDQWLTSPLRIRLSNAGLNKPAMLLYFIAAKPLLACALPLTMFVLLTTYPAVIPWSLIWLAVVISALLGYFLPNGILDRMVAKRQHELFMAFPDALDLLRVCVEAGLGLDAAIKRVGQEIQLESHALAQEFSLLGLELRAGASRNNALRNLALRIGLEDINSLVSMLIQADRFGTSMADSLRVHSESLRSKRRIKAEEAAAKLPVKILLPLIFCVFPSLLTVLMGPAVINILQLLMPRMANA